MSIFPDHPDDDRLARRLLPFLDAAVPLWAAEAATWEPERQVAEGIRCGDILAYGADCLFRPDDAEPPSVAQRRSVPDVLTITKEQADAGVKAIGFRPAEVFNAIACALGLGALLPGGVTWLGRHWCTEPHAGCRAGFAARRAEQRHGGRQHAGDGMRLAWAPRSPETGPQA